MLSQPLGIFAFYDTLSRALRARAFYRFQSENESAVGDAWKDILADLRLFRRAAHQTAWLAEITDKMEFDASRSNDIQKIAVTFEQWTLEQLDQAIADLETLPRWQDRETTHKIIQFTMLDIIQTLGAEGGFTNLQHRAYPPAVDTDSALQTINIISFDWNLVAKELNKTIKQCDELFAEAEGKSLNEQSNLLDLRKTKEQNNKDFIEKQTNKIVRAHFESHGIPGFLFASRRSNLVGTILGGPLFTFMAKKMYLLQVEEESRCQALRIVLALERFHREKQQYPKSLDELGLKPLDKDMDFEYSSWDSGYTLHNNVFEYRRD